VGILTQRITFKWFLQVYAGLKVFHYLASLIILPREWTLGRPFRVPLPFNELDLGWRMGLRLLGLGCWLIVFFWAGGRLWPASNRSPEMPANH
jgi:hypothetical protein